MTIAICMRETGGADVLTVGRAEVGTPASGEVLVRQTFVGVNYVDIYHRTGLYPLPSLPAVPGVEAAGVVEAVGPSVDSFQPGDRVAYAGLPAGAYVGARLLPATRLVKLPDHFSDQVAAGMMLRGMTAHMLLHRLRPIGPGAILLVHAAAGGLGLILTQWAKRLGATVIGTVGSEAKASLAVAHGLDHPIIYRETDFVAEVKRLTDGRGVDFAIDGIGADTLIRTFDCVRSFGMIASVGQAGGAIPTFHVTELGPRRSLALSRPSVLAYVADGDAYREAAHDLFEQVAAGLRIEIGAVLPLKDAAVAHRALEAGATTGSVILSV